MTGEPVKLESVTLTARFADGSVMTLSTEDAPASMSVTRDVSAYQRELRDSAVREWFDPRCDLLITLTAARRYNVHYERAAPPP